MTTMGELRKMGARGIICQRAIVKGFPALCDHVVREADDHEACGG